jgi:hypothetical protein
MWYENGVLPSFVIWTIIDPRNHPVPMSQLQRETDSQLIECFNIILNHTYRDGTGRYPFHMDDLPNYMVTLSRILRIVRGHAGGIGILHLAPEMLNYFNRAQERFYTQQPQLALEFHYQAPPGQLIVRPEAEEFIVQHQSGQQNIYSRLQGTSKEDQEVEMRARRAAENEAKDKKQTQNEEFKARKMKEDAARQLKETERVREEKARQLAREKEAAKKIGKIVEEAHLLDEEKDDKEREIEEIERQLAEGKANIAQLFERGNRDKKRQEEAARRRREADAQRLIDDERRHDEETRKESDRQRRIHDERRIDKEVERRIRDKDMRRVDDDRRRDEEDDRRRYEDTQRRADDDRKQAEETEWRRQDKRTTRASDTHRRIDDDRRRVGDAERNTLRHVVPDNDEDSDSDDEDKKADPYQLLGLDRREATLVADIRVTQRRLNEIFGVDNQTYMGEGEKRVANKRLAEIKFAADILLDPELRRAYDESGAIFSFEVNAWRKKSKSVVHSAIAVLI